jgi:blue copper oxidase
MATLNRRKFLRYLGITGLALASGGVGALLEGCSPYKNMDHANQSVQSVENSLGSAKIGDFVNPLNIPGEEGLLGVIEVPAKSFDITAQLQEFELVKGKKTRLSIYQVESNGKKYFNPTFKIKRDGKFMANLINKFEEKTIIHWHGLKVDWKMDAHPNFEINKGQKYSYKFSIPNRSGTYWYHPHPYRNTAKQAYSGLAGFFIVEDADEIMLTKELDLQLGKTDIPLVIQDKKFDENGNLSYSLTEMEKQMGIIGGVILTNLTVTPFLEVAKRVYRFRLLNGSNSKIYLFAFVKGQEKLKYNVIGTDGGFLDKPYKIEQTFLSPGERLDVLIDFSGLKNGEEVYLKSLPFDPMDNEETDSNKGQQGHTNMASMLGISMGNGQENYILRLVISDKVTVGNISKIPQVLFPLETYKSRDIPTRPINLSIKDNKWLINGETFVADKYPITVEKNSPEIWDITNDKKSMPHPMHIHGTFFRVMARCDSPKQVRSLAVDDGGRLVGDLGYKDTVLIWPGETVRVAIDFNHKFEGEQIYLFHCHNLEHEEAGMMINVKVK